MAVVNKQGIRVSDPARPTRMDSYSPGIDELSDAGPESERDGAIIALNKKCRWSPVRLSRLFGLSERQVFRVIAEFDEFLEDATA